MKKSIIALFFLLFLLIGTCVYQKTYTLYAFRVENQKTPTHETQKETLVESKILHQKREAKSTIDHAKNEKAVAEVLHVPHKVTGTKAVATKQMHTPKEEKTHTINATNKRVDAVTRAHIETKALSNKQMEILEKDKKEIVTYLMSEMNQKDLAFKDRAQVEENLRVLIERVLQDRLIAIAQMDQVLTEVQEQQDALVKQRDTTAQNISSHTGE